MDASRLWKHSALVFATVFVVAFHLEGIDAQPNAITGPGARSVVRFGGQKSTRNPPRGQTPNTGRPICAVRLTSGRDQPPR